MQGSTRNIQAYKPTWKERRYLKIVLQPFLVIHALHSAVTAITDSGPRTTTEQNYIM